MGGGIKVPIKMKTDHCKIFHTTINNNYEAADGTMIDVYSCPLCGYVNLEEREVKMKFKIQDFSKDRIHIKPDTRIYFSLELTHNDERLVLCASNTEGNPGQQVLVIREDGILYRPAGVSVYGLATVNQRLMLGT